MISVAEAKKIILKNIPTPGGRQLQLSQAAGLVLAADIYSSLDIPAFPQSSMDGYAFCFADWQDNSPLMVNGEIPAGFGEANALLKQQAIRIFTGAAVPPGADTVVMQEKVSKSGNELLILDEKITKGANVRAKGSEMNSGQLALASGSILTPAAIGFLAGIGVTHVTVYPKPAITIIVTGKELQQPGQPLAYGQVYESNSATLLAALEQLAISDVKVIHADDDLGILTSILGSAVGDSDIVLLTGGVSVGDYDFVLEASNLCGIDTLFHKIKQRPGKPLFFGRKEKKLVFGLPGNPSSVLTCFYQYVIPALQEFSRRKNPVQIINVPSVSGYQKPSGLTHFLKAIYDGKTISLLGAQESYRLSSFAQANCLVELEEDTVLVSAGDIVQIHLFP
ncbi:MAG: molybdopterin molybdotransferase MoeA [Ferruginibacter sp.]|nr:molybdopterin molybdotransferase MoeA [Ferruginibacter sp.]